ncbi:MAG: FUSC family protein [Rickettsiella sp.]|nr:FUSC family protein [Rickettsiella sp.]
MTNLDSNRLIHSLKTAIAFLIGIFIVRVFAFPQRGQWILISILVVMCAQSRVGAMMQKSYMRFLGTVIGASIAALTLWLAYPNVVWTTLILCLTTALFSYIADSPGYFSEAGPLGAVTTVIILVGQDPSYTSVISRFFEISLGIIIALLVSRFIWPLHSRTQLRFVVTITLQDLEKLLQQLKIFFSPEAEKTFQDYESKIISRFANQTKLLDEVLRESFGRTPLALMFNDILQGEREILRCINLMKSALINFSSATRLIFNQQEQVQKIYELSNQLFTSLIEHFNMKSKALVALNITSDWKEKMQQELNTLIMSTSDKLAVDLFIFSAGNLITQLNKMNSLVKKA